MLLTHHVCINFFTKIELLTRKISQMQKLDIFTIFPPKLLMASAIELGYIAYSHQNQDTYLRNEGVRCGQNTQISVCILGNKVCKRFTTFFFTFWLFSNYFSNGYKLYIPTILRMPLTTWGEKIMKLFIFFRICDIFQVNNSIFVHFFMHSWQIKSM